MNATAEHRNTTRIRSFLRGEVQHSNGSSRTECTVRDLSVSGARMEIPSSVTLPEYFELFIPQRNLREKSRIVWRHANEIGVAFQNSHQSAPSAPEDNPLELKVRVLELEAETTRLRAELAEVRGMVATLMRQKIA